MNLIELSALPNGAHRNQNGPLAFVPEGWAQIPEDLAIPSTFPFVELETAEVNGVTTVTALIPGIVPEPEELEPTQEAE